jgi:SAM-dependent methyltransferase
VKRLSESTIEDFGEQWNHYTESTGFYGDVAFLQDLCRPLLKLNELIGMRVLDIGSGTGRLVTMFLKAGASHVIALEPSQAVNVLRRNVAANQNVVEVIHGTVDVLNPEVRVDFVFCVGVLHHSAEPLSILRAAARVLRPGGRLFLWVYGREGNGVYLLFFRPLHLLFRCLPDIALRAVCRWMAGLFRLYAIACKHGPWPMANYFVNIYQKLTHEQQELILFDQLNPRYARYYRQSELQDLFNQTDFHSVHLHHRHGYSWSAVATR